jgi:hypothetical protein
VFLSSPVVNEEPDEDEDDWEQDAIEHLNPEKQLDHGQMRDERGRGAADDQHRKRPKKSGARKWRLTPLEKPNASLTA